MSKRLFDLIAGGLLLIVVSPLLVLIALAVKLNSPGPVFFRQERVGQYGRIFRIHKFRTMVSGAEHIGPSITIGDDRRITTVGRILRRLKLDELAQLIDVLLGQMSLVGPRPELPRFVALYPPEMRQLIEQLRPGLTDLASIRYRNESQLLAASADPESAYIREIMPRKLQLYCQYANRHTLAGDILILARTLIAVLFRYGNH
jgi:lipopolysaccharide/colanic/teichoic acid biosynthesis glycosyltransferase